MRRGCLVLGIFAGLALAVNQTAAAGAQIDAPAYRHDGAAPDIQEAAAPVSAPLVTGAMTSRVTAADQLVEQRLLDNLTDEMLQNFSLFVYVSKAAAGPWAQRMYVFQKQTDGKLYLLYNWPVSTGREGLELSPSGRELPTYTPAGYYQLDPDRFYPQYHSTQWNESMPYAMFFRWRDHGIPTGIAIHAATDEGVNVLGSRASAGCIRLAPENARVLYALVHDYQGTVPQFAFDEASKTVLNNGLLAHDLNGNLQFARGYRVLIFIDEYGGQDLEAALY